MPCVGYYLVGAEKVWNSCNSLVSNSSYGRAKALDAPKIWVRCCCSRRTFLRLGTWLHVFQNFLQSRLVWWSGLSRTRKASCLELTTSLIKPTFVFWFSQDFYKRNVSSLPYHFKKFSVTGLWKKRGES